MERVMTLYKSEAATELSRFATAERELATALQCIKRIRAQIELPEQDRDNLLMMAHWESAILRATRVFEGKLPLPQSILREIIEGAPEALEYLTKVRNKHVAHRVNPVDQVKVGVFVLDEPGPNGEVIDGVGTLSMELALWSDPEHLKTFGQFVVHLGKRVAELQKLWQTRVQDEASAQPHKTLRTLAPARLYARRQGHLVEPDA